MAKAREFVPNIIVNKLIIKYNKNINPIINIDPNIFLKKNAIAFIKHENIFLSSVNNMLIYKNPRKFNIRYVIESVITHNSKTKISCDEKEFRNE